LVELSSIPGRAKLCYLLCNLQTGLGTILPLVQWMPGNLFSEVKRPGRKCDHSPLSNVEVKGHRGTSPLPRIFLTHSAYAQRLYKVK
jgi:hypothetical protein